MNSSEHFEAIAGEHYEPLFRFAMSLTRVESDAQDLTQQTFYVWATKGHQLRDISKVKTWLYTTLHRAFLNSHRRQNRFSHCELEEVAEELPGYLPDIPEQADYSQVLPALAGVDAVYRAAVALFYLDDCSYKEIATILGVPLGTVKSRIARGILQLRGILMPQSSGSALPNGDVSCAIGDEASERAREILLPHLETQHCSTPGASERTYDEWDFSSTRLLEPNGA